MQLFDVMEDNLSIDKKWRLSQWLTAAKQWATCDEEAILLEYNARNQITLWGPRGEIMDYANKQWSGELKQELLFLDCKHYKLLQRILKLGVKQYLRIG